MTSDFIANFVCKIEFVFFFVLAMVFDFKFSHFCSPAAVPLVLPPAFSVLLYSKYTILNCKLCKWNMQMQFFFTDYIQIFQFQFGWLACRNYFNLYIFFAHFYPVHVCTVFAFNGNFVNTFFSFVRLFNCTCMCAVSWALF